MAESKTGFAANEPVVVGGVVAWVFSFVGTLILGHTDLINSTQWSTLSSILIPVISAAVLTLIAYVTRKFVTPAWKAGVHQAGRVGITEDQLQVVAQQAAEQALALQHKHAPVFDPVVHAGEEAYLQDDFQDPEAG